MTDRRPLPAIPGKPLITRVDTAVLLNTKSTDEPRRCGTCTACCEVPEIDDPALKKPAHTKCEHLYSIGGSKRGCSTYETRPDVCRAFSCMWILGMGHKDDRPDKTGCIVTVQDVGVPGVRDLNTRVQVPWIRAALLGKLGRRSDVAPNGHFAFVVQEAWKGAAEKEGAHVVVGIHRHAGVFVITREGQRRMHGPPWWTSNLTRMTLEEAGNQPIPIADELGGKLPDVVDAADVVYCSCAEPQARPTLIPPRCIACGHGLPPTKPPLPTRCPMCNHGDLVVDGTTISCPYPGDGIDDEECGWSEDLGAFSVESAVDDDSAGVAQDADAAVDALYEAAMEATAAPETKRCAHANDALYADYDRGADVCEDCGATWAYGEALSRTKRQKGEPRRANGGES